MFNAPNNWKLDASGKLIKDRETEEYKAAVGYMRDLFAAGVFWPDSISSTNARTDFIGKKFAVSPEGQGNSWVDFWQRGRTLNPPSRFAMIPPFPAQNGQNPIHFLGTGFVSMNVLKKASPDRIKELLRIMNWLGSPFGSEEDMLLTYGLKDQDYTLDDKGNPKPTTEGTQADTVWQDGVREIILGRTPMTDYDRLIKDWQTAAGDQIRKEYLDAMAAAK